MNLADLSCYLWPDGYEGRQPQDTYQIDTSLGVNIAAAVSRGNYDIAAQVFRLVSGALPLAVTAGGIGLKNTGSSTNYLTIPAPIGAGTVFAVLAVYVPNTATGTHLICDADNSATDRDFQLRQNGTAVEFIRFNTTPSAVTASVSGALKIGAPTTILAISDGVNVTLYAGSGIGTATITGSPSSWTCSGEWLSRSSNHTGTPLGTNGSLCLGAYITGAVPPATAKILVSNPWQMFVAPVDVGWPIAASVGGSYALAAVGVSTADGSATPSVNIPLSAAGFSVSGGGANALATITISAAGLAQAAGSATLNITVALNATGSSQSSGSANLSGGAPGQVSASGGAQAGGSAQIKATVSISAAGYAQAMASGQLSIHIPISAFGSAISSGSAHLVDIGGSLILTRAPAGAGPLVIKPSGNRPPQTATTRPSNTGGRRL